MPFGLKNTPATFQRLMNEIFGDLLNHTLLVYLDDILIFTETFGQQINALLEVLTRLTVHHLKLNISKFLFLLDQITYLGHKINSEGLKPNPDKIAAIVEFKIPKNVKQLQSFLGLTNYYI